MGRFFLISGDDEFSRKARAKEVAAELCGGEDPLNSSVAEVIAGDNPEYRPENFSVRLLEALRTPPFLCDKKVIWMRHHPDLALLLDSADEASREIAALLAAPLPPEIDLIVDGPGLDRRKTVVKEMKNAGAQIEVFMAAKSSDRNYAESRRDILTSFAKKTKKRIAPDAMNYLTEAIGGDSGMLANELEKLHCYTGNAAEITLQDCRAVVSRTQEALTWEYSSAVIACDTARALATLETLLHQRESGMELRLIAGLSREFQQMIQTHLAMKQLNIRRAGPNTFSSLPPELKEQFPDNPLLKIHPFRAYKVCESAERFGGAELAQKLTAIRNASRALVSGGGVSRIILEQLTCRLCRRQKNA